MNKLHINNEMIRKKDYIKGMEETNSLINLRKKAGLTQLEVSTLCHISLRSYQMYEHGEGKTDSLKYKYIYNVLSELTIDYENKGILSIDEIKKICHDVFTRYNVSCAYLYGSYAKGRAKESSDVDLFIISEETGLRYFGLVEELREKLHKRVEIVTQRKAKNNPDFLFNEVMPRGIRIYNKEEV